MDDYKAQFVKDNFGRNLWLDIVNSAHYDGFGNLTDHLADPNWLLTLLEHYQFANTLQNSPPQPLLNFRTWLRQIAQTLDKNTPLTATDLATLNSYLAEPGVRSLCFSAETQTYSLTFKPVQSDWRWVQAEAAASLVAMLAPKQQKRVKICPNSGCNWVFFDTTRGNNRRWCNDLTCGNRAKVRRFRALRKREGQ